MLLFLRRICVATPCNSVTLSGSVSGPDGPSPFSASENTIRVQKATGNDLECSVGGSPCQTIARALTIATSGVEIYVAPGTYNEHSLTVPRGVTLQGSQADLVRVQHLSAETDSTVLMIESDAHVQDLQVMLTSTQHHALTGIAFLEGAFPSASMRRVRVEVDNSAATSEGSSVVVGVSIAPESEAQDSSQVFETRTIEDSQIEVISIGGGNATALSIAIQSSHVLISKCTIRSTMVSGSALESRAVGIFSQSVNSVVTHSRYTTVSATNAGDGTAVERDVPSPIVLSDLLASILLGSIANCPSGVICVQSTPWGNDVKCSKGYWPCLTIARGLALATAGDNVRVYPGEYNEHDLTVPPLVVLRGALLASGSNSVILRATNVVANTTMINLSSYSVIENMLLELSSTQHVQLRGIFFIPGSTTVAYIRGVTIRVHNSAASTTGLSLVMGIHSSKSLTSATDPTMDIVTNSRVHVSSIGRGIVRGILLDTVGGRFRVSFSSVLAEMIGSSSTGVAVAYDETIGTGDFFQSNLAATTAGLGGRSFDVRSGTSTSNILLLGSSPVNCPANTVCVAPSPWGDDQRCKVGYWACATMATAMSRATSGSATLVLVFPGTYSDVSFTIPTGVTVRGVDRNTVLFVASTAAGTYNMGINSRLEEITFMRITTLTTFTFTFVNFFSTGSATSNARVSKCNFLFDNTAAISTSTATVTIFLLNTASPTTTSDYNWESITDCNVTINAISNSGTLLIGISASNDATHPIRVARSTFSIRVISGTGVAQVVRRGDALNAAAFFRDCALFSSDVVGTRSYFNTAAVPTPSFNAMNTFVVVASPGGDDLKCALRYWPCATLSKALSLASAGMTVIMGMLTSTETITIPTGVTLRGMSRWGRTGVLGLAISPSGSTGSTSKTVVTMSPFSRLIDIRISVLSIAAGFSITGIDFAGTSAASATVEHVRIEFTGAAGLISSSTVNMIGVQSTSTAAAIDGSRFTLDDVDIFISGRGLGVKRGIKVSGANTIRARNTHMFVRNTADSADDYIAVETITSSQATVLLENCYCSGTTADISRSTGSITLERTSLEHSNANGKSFTSPHGIVTFTFGKINAITSAATIFIGHNEDSTSILNTFPHIACVANALTVTTNSGGSTSSTITVQKNAVDTSMAVVLPAGTFQSVIQDTVSVALAATDKFAIKWTRSSAVTQAGNVTITLQCYTG
jgi:hypothetical protein